MHEYNIILENLGISKNPGILNFPWYFYVTGRFPRYYFLYLQKCRLTA